jgi:branched-subunit amino acid aminotransferase/4-amino-4-deoxychorismate lyase
VTPAVFETMLVEEGRVRLLDRHLARLRAAGVRRAQVDEVRAAVAELAATATEPVVVRIEVADDAVAVRPRVPRPASAVSGVLVEAYDPSDRTREQKRTARGWADAAEAAAGGEALLVSPDGLIGETTRANLFAIVGETVVTPPVSGILPGVTRSFVLERTGAVERPLTLADLQSADDLFLTSSLRGIRPVRTLDGTPLKQTDPLVERLASTLRRRWLDEGVG